MSEQIAFQFSAAIQPQTAIEITEIMQLQAMKLRGIDDYEQQLAQIGADFYVSRERALYLARRDMARHMEYGSSYPDQELIELNQHLIHLEWVEQDIKDQLKLRRRLAYLEQIREEQKGWEA